MALKAYALTTVARVEAFAGLTGLTPAQEAVLESIVNMATEYIENYTGRRFQLTSYTEEYSGSGTDTLVLKNFPISGSVTVESRDTSLNEGNWSSVDSKYIFVDATAGVLYKAGDGEFFDGRNRYRVTYNAGYDFDNSATFLSDTEAGDVEFVVWKLVAEAWDSRNSGKPVEGERLGDYAITFGKSLFELTGEGGGVLKSILDQYRNRQVQSYKTPINT